MTVRPLSTALKCFDLIDVLAEASHADRLADIARKTGESRATTYQRLLTLCEAGWVERLPQDTYRLSLKACRIGYAALGQAGLGDRALPVLEKLTAETGETSSLVVLEAGKLVIAQRVESRGILRADLRIGAELSVQDSASGKIWLAFGSEAATAGLEGSLPENMLTKIRQGGFALGGGGSTLPGIGVVAVPVFDGGQNCVASLSLVGPETRFDTKRLIEPLKQAANDLRDSL
ncbi:MAG: IclR family transcriptional regulator [Pseudomonadota bacterium]